MGFRFQRRLNLTNGLGLNLSKSGASLSLRTQAGSIGTKGFSIRSGIPGLSYRQSWGKGSGGAAAIVGLIFVIVALMPLLISLAVIGIKLMFWLFALAIDVFLWVLMTLFDLMVYLFHGRKMEAAEPKLIHAGTPIDTAAVPASRIPLSAEAKFYVAVIVLMVLIVVASIATK